MNGKIALIMLVILLLALLFFGYGKTELEQRAIAGVISIDKTDGGYSVGAATYTVSDTDSNDYLLEGLSGEGNTLGEAMENCRKKSTRELYLGHCIAVVISDDVANSLESLLHEITDCDLLSVTTAIFFTEGNAKEMIFAETGTAFGVTESVSNLAAGDFEVTRIYELLTQNEKPNGCVPVISLYDFDSIGEIKRDIKISGIYVFDNGRYNLLKGDSLEGAELLCGMKKAVNYSGKKIPVKIRVKYADNCAVIKIIGISFKNGTVSEDIKESVTTAISESARSNIDILRLGRMSVVTDEGLDLLSVKYYVI